jgi:lactoylglutathione lyase
LPDFALETFFPIIRVRDLEQSIVFYDLLLGMQQSYRWPEEGEPQFVVVGVGETALGIGRAQRPYQADDRYELCFYVDDVDRAVAELRAAGVRVEREPEDMPWGERMAWVSDPDGNRVHLTARSSETVTSS